MRLQFSGSAAWTSNYANSRNQCPGPEQLGSPRAGLYIILVWCNWVLKCVLSQAQAPACVIPPCLSEKKEARQDSRGPGQGSERANLMKLQTGTRPQFTVIGGHAECETRKRTAAGYSVHTGIFTDHSRNGQVWVYTLGTTHVPRILPTLVTSSWSPAQCHSCSY